MKPIKKDVPRQERRKRTLARLEVYLKGGVKNAKISGEGKIASYTKAGVPIVKWHGKVVGVQVPFEEKDVERIKKEIAALKVKLGVV